MQEIAYPIPRKKTVVGGIILAVLGLMGLLVAAGVLPVWLHDANDLRIKEILGEDSSQDHNRVNVETTLVLGGFLVGGPMLMIGLVLVASAMSYNGELEKAALQRAFNAGVQFGKEEKSGSSPRKSP